MSATVGETLAANVLQRRAVLGLTGRQLAKRCGMSNSSVWNAERGVELTMRTVRKLADGLGCTVAALMAEPSCSFCRDLPLPGWVCGTCGQGARPGAGNVALSS